MIPAFFQRLNPRERVLVMIVGGGLFLLLNWIIWSWISGTLSQCAHRSDRAQSRPRAAERFSERARHVGEARSVA